MEEVAANESREALAEHQEEMAQMTISRKKRRRNRVVGAKRKKLYKFLCCPCRFVKCVLRSIAQCTMGAGRMWHFVYAWVMWEFFGRVTHHVNREQYLLEKYMDQRGELIVIFRTLKLSDEQRLRWVELWNAIDADENNTMDIEEYRMFFEFTSKATSNLIYTKRLFRIFNRNLNGFVNLRDFLVTAWSYCPYDASKVRSGEEQSELKPNETTTTMLWTPPPSQLTTPLSLSPRRWRSSASGCSAGEETSSSTTSQSSTSSTSRSS